MSVATPEPVSPEDYLQCMYCTKTYVLTSRFKWHVKNHHNEEADWESALSAYLDTRADDEAQAKALREHTGKSFKHPETIDLVAFKEGKPFKQVGESAVGTTRAASIPKDAVIIDDLSGLQGLHLAAIAAMTKTVDSNKLLTFELAKNGSDHLRVLANKLSNRVQGGLSLDDRLDIAKQMYTMAGLLEQLYQELKDTDLRKLQNKARRWDRVAIAVSEAIAEEAKADKE